MNRKLPHVFGVIAFLGSLCGVCLLVGTALCENRWEWWEAETAERPAPDRGFVKGALPKSGVWRLVILRTVDGDTVEAGIVVSLGKVRVAGLDTPERGQKGYRAAKTRLAELLPPWEIFPAELREGDKYGRPLATFWREEDWDGESVPDFADTINHEMIDEGHALEYWGGKKALREKGE